MENKKTKNIEELLINFPFADKISRSRAIALLITPFIYINGIKPIGVYLGNRERIGKDYLASITRILANDTAGELPPLQNDEETRKTLLALSMANEEFCPLFQQHRPHEQPKPRTSRNIKSIKRADSWKNQK